VSEKFFREPLRPIHYDPSVFYSPADGFILYSMTVGPDQRIVQVKGRNLTVRELLQCSKFSAKSLIIGIFLTFYDVHVNRLPTDGFVHFSRPPAIENAPMNAVESSILQNGAVHPDDFGYAFTNERVVTCVYSTQLSQFYYLVQIADREVNTISLFPQEGEKLRQGERFGLMRFGSQVDLIIPLTNPRIKFTSLVERKALYHVESGVDKLVRVDAVGT
jgi:phosphatidylserine decarboxylase